MADLTESSTLQTPPSRQVPFREDCWSEEATATLVDTWGQKFMDLNRGNLRQKDWQEVADAVNDLHGHTKKTRRTDVQCKNRIDTLKKKYKVERNRIAESNGMVTSSSWPFYDKLNFLIGSNFSKNQSRNQVAVVLPSPTLSLPSPPMAVPLAYRKGSVNNAVVTPVNLPQKRPSPAGDIRRNYSQMAAAAAAAEDEEYDDEEEATEGEEEEEVVRRGVVEVDGGEEGMRMLARAIEKFGEVYERVESMKQKQMIDMEKQRMQFARDLEVQRMQLFMDTQVQLEKMKKPRRSGSSDDAYS